MKRKENQKTQKPLKKRGRPPKKESQQTQQNQQASSNLAPEPEKTPSVDLAPYVEKTLSESPTIKTISKALVDVSQGVIESEKRTSQLVEQRVNQTEEKIGKLAEALSAITNYVTKAASGPQTQNPSASPEIDKPPAQAGTQDKLMYWGSLLAKLAELGKSPAPPIQQPSSNTEEGLARGFNLMMGVITKLMEVQSGFRKNFLEEIRDTFTIFPKTLKEPKKETHLGE